MHPEVERAIEQMYAAFARPTPREVDGCPCCITPEELRALVETPLRELSGDQLGSYSFSVLLTVGDVADLRYFWPRIAELSARGELWTDIEVVFDKPRRGEWRSWPRAEQEAIERFARAVMDDLARRELDAFEVDGWVCAFGRMMEDVVPLLAPLLEPTAAAGANLFSLYSWNARRIGRGKLTNAFWDEESAANEARVAAWLRGDAVSEALGRHYAGAGA
jgi:hypothetical protein